MKELKGRRTKKDREAVIKNILLFIFLFKTVPPSFLDLFGVKILGIARTKDWQKVLIKEGYCKVFSLSLSAFGIKNRMAGSRYFFLSDKGVKFLKDAPGVSTYLGGYPIERYRFFPSVFRVQLLKHNLASMRAFIHMQSRDLNGRWQSEWMARGLLWEGSKHRLGMARSRLPDGVFVTSKGIRVSVECELSPKNKVQFQKMVGAWENGVVARDRFDPVKKTYVEGQMLYDFVLVVCGTQSLFERVYEQMKVSIKVRKDKFVVTTLDWLEKGVGWGFDGEKRIDEIFGIGVVDEGSVSV